MCPLFLFSAFKIICNCRVKQKQSDQNKEHSLQSEKAVLQGSKACEQHTDQSVKYCVAIVCGGNSFGLKQIAGSKLFQRADLFFVAAFAGEYIIRDGGTFGAKSALTVFT